jgi:hypothetical protein
MNIDNDISYIFILFTIGFLAYKRIKVKKIVRSQPSNENAFKENYLTWLAKAKQKLPNEPSEVYKYWFLACQKTSSPEVRKKLLDAFIEKKRITETVSHLSISRILGKTRLDGKLDDEFVRQLYYHFLLISIFTQEKIVLETTSFVSVYDTDGLFDSIKFEEHLNQEIFDIAFLDLLPGKIKQLSESSRRATIDANIVNFFDEDPFNGIQLNMGINNEQTP